MLVKNIEISQYFKSDKSNEEQDSKMLLSVISCPSNDRANTIQEGNNCFFWGAEGYCKGLAKGDYSCCGKLVEKSLYALMKKG